MICKTCQQPVRVSAGPTSYGGWVHVDSRFDTHRIVLTGIPESGDISHLRAREHKKEGKDDEP